jgi:predicted alpha/beta-hydrolase family hydrolase
MPASEALRIEQRPVRVAAGRVTLDGDLGLPQGARAVVLFAHGSGSGRYSSRNRHVARVLNEAKLATLLIDLLTMRKRRTCASTSPCSRDG